MIKNNNIGILNMDNMDFISDYPINLIYADMIYENPNLEWIHHYWHQLSDNGIFIVQTDYHTNYTVRWEFESIQDSMFINHLVWKMNGVIISKINFINVTMILLFMLKVIIINFILIRFRLIKLLKIKV